MSKKKPVAWMYVEPNNPYKTVHTDDYDYEQMRWDDEWFPVYTAANVGRTFGVKKESEGEEHVTDMVNHPAHYKVGGIETIDYMKAKSTPEEFKGHLRLTAIKYLSRTGYKDDALQDLKKAQWYLNRLIQECEAESPTVRGVTGKSYEDVNLGKEFR